MVCSLCLLFIRSSTCHHLGAYNIAYSLKNFLGVFSLCSCSARATTTNNGSGLWENHLYAGISFLVNTSGINSPVPMWIAVSLPSYFIKV